MALPQQTGRVQAVQAQVEALLSRPATALETVLFTPVVGHTQKLQHIMKEREQFWLSMQ